MTLLWQGGWTRWPTEVPSNPEHSVWFCDSVTGWEGRAHSSKTQFSNKLVFQRTCASTSKHSSLSYLFFFNLGGESSSHSEGTLGKLPLRSPAAPNISLHHYANATLVFPHSGEGPDPGFPLPPTAAYSPHSAAVEDWMTAISICLCFSSDLGFGGLLLDILVAALCLRVSLFQFSNVMKH